MLVDILNDHADAVCSIIIFYFLTRLTLRNFM